MLRSAALHFSQHACVFFLFGRNLWVHSSPCFLPPTRLELATSLPADFKALHFPPPPGAHKPGSADFVRRRRWVRRRRREGRPAFPAAAAAASAAGRALGAAAALGQHIIAGPLGKHEDQLVVKQRQVLGRAAPGEALPLPLGWSAPGRQLQLRPVLPVRGAAGAADQQAQQEQGAEQTAEGQQPAEEEGELQAVHDWSHGTSGGQHTVKLDCLDEGITRLVCCPSLGATQGKWGQWIRGFVPHWDAAAAAALSLHKLFFFHLRLEWAPFIPPPATQPWARPASYK